MKQELFDHPVYKHAELLMKNTIIGAYSAVRVVQGCLSDIYPQQQFNLNAEDEKEIIQSLHKKYRADREAERIKKNNESYKVGAIMSSSWGYDQTNIDFYEIVKITDKTIWLIEIGKIKGQETSFMTNTVMPNKEVKVGKMFHRKLCWTEGKIAGCSIEYGWCSIWNGQPETESHYA
jgi:hypothetical protein